MEKAAFGAGCFWGVEAVFRKVPGVSDAVCGYMGGKTENPTYKNVCYDDTGHAEVVQVEFDPAIVSYDALLEVFWRCHNPTQLNRQGPDVGDQYRSAIFTYSDAQAAAARTSKDALQQSGKWKDAIVTEITPAPTFYKAEEYHQRYLEKQGRDSCHI